MFRMVKLGFALSFAVLIGTGVAQGPGGTQRPVDRIQFTGMLLGGTTNERLATLVRNRGVCLSCSRVI